MNRDHRPHLTFSQRKALVGLSVCLAVSLAVLLAFWLSTP